MLKSKHIILIVTVLALIVGTVIVFLLLRNPQNDNHDNDNSKNSDVEAFDVTQYQWEISNFSSTQNVGDVNDKKVAIEKAKSLWSEKYDISANEAQLEVEYDSKEDCWHVYNTPEQNTVGGVYHVIFRKDGDVVAIWAED